MRSPPWDLEQGVVLDSEAINFHWCIAQKVATFLEPENNSHTYKLLMLKFQGTDPKIISLALPCISSQCYISKGFFQPQKMF